MAAVGPEPAVGEPVLVGNTVAIGEPTGCCTPSAEDQFADKNDFCAGPITGPAPLLLARDVEGVYEHGVAGKALRIVLCMSCCRNDCYCGCCFFGMMPFLPIWMCRSATCQGKKTNSFTSMAVQYHSHTDRYTLHYHCCCCPADKFVRIAE